jgi:hypothetical protein
METKRISQVANHNPVAALGNVLHSLDDPAAGASAHRQQLVDCVELNPGTFPALLDGPIDPASPASDAAHETEKSQCQYEHRAPAENQAGREAAAGTEQSRCQLTQSILGETLMVGDLLQQIGLAQPAQQKLLATAVHHPSQATGRRLDGWAEQPLDGGPRQGHGIGLEGVHRTAQARPGHYRIGTHS